MNGYSRKITEQGVSTWKYSDRAIDAMLQYQKNFPEVFEHMVSYGGQNDIFYQDDVFGAENW